MATHTATLHLNRQSFADQIQSGVTLVDFWATWCPPCVALGPTIDALAADYQDRAAVAKVDVDAENAIAAAFGVQSIPTIIFFKDGKEVERTVGLQPRDKLAAILDNLLES